ncbi:MAG: DUF3131 domain-containing protein, partial [Leptolyngbya sp. SIO3F4]|nr:DUF3131 domain-containing protein [Leptolyngbya sp. SIO3F4]
MTSPHFRPWVGLFASLITLSSLTACASGTIGIGSKQSDFKAAATDESSNNLCGELSSPLTSQEKEYATVAWQYFVNNRQAETGFTNSADQFPSGTLWDQGNYLMALNAVRWMDLIDQDEFDLQLNQFLTSLGELPLVENALPNKVYNSSTGEMVDYGNNPTQKGLGWSALDIGRFLTALHIIRTCHPQYNSWISGLMSGWQLPRSIQEGQLYGAVVKSNGKLLPVQEGRLGYEEYAARGYELWGFEAPKALDADPMKLVEVSGVKIPVDQRNFEDTDANNYVVSESYILEEIEFGW